MKRGKDLIKNTIIIAIGNFSTKIISFLLLPIYTSYLTTKDYGVYDLLCTIAIFVVPVITLLLEESMFRFLIDCKSDDEKSIVISNSFIYIISSFIIFTVIYFLLSLVIKIPYSLMFYFYILSSVVIALKNALTRGIGKVKLYTVSNFFSSLIIILCNILFILKFNLGIGSLLLSYIIGNILVSFFVFIKLDLSKYISVDKFNKNKFKEMVNYSLPLVPNSLSWTIVNLSDRIIISSLIGASANGIYSISYKFPTLMDTIYGFFYTSWKEIAAKSLKDNDVEEFYNKVYSILKNFLWSVVIFMLAIMPFVFNFLIKNAFQKAYLYIPILVVSMYFSNMSGYLGGIFTAYKNTKILGTTTIIAAIINVVINLVLIKYLGLWAAAISTLFSTSFIYFYRKKQVKRYIKLFDNNKIIIMNILSILLVFLSYYSNNIFIQILNIVFLVFYCLFINKEVVFQIFKILKKRIK